MPTSAAITLGMDKPSEEAISFDGLPFFQATRIASSLGGRVDVAHLIDGWNSSLSDFTSNHQHLHELLEADGTITIRVSLFQNLINFLGLWDKAESVSIPQCVFE